MENTITMATYRSIPSFVPKKMIAIDKSAFEKKPVKKTSKSNFLLVYATIPPIMESKHAKMAIAIYTDATAVTFIFIKYPKRPPKIRQIIAIVIKFPF